LSHHDSNLVDGTYNMYSARYRSYSLRLGPVVSANLITVISTCSALTSELSKLEFRKV